MTEHYYSAKPGARHDLHRLEETLRGHKLMLLTDAGVFSKKGVDFGSKLLIETMSFPDNAQVLDVGCGYGPIGLSAALLAAKGHVTMVDINERAVELARQNAEANRIQNVTIMQSDRLEAVQDNRFDVVLTNPPIRAGKEIVHSIFEQACEALKPGGSLWVVIQKKQGAPSAYAKLEMLFAEVKEVERDKGYWIVQATKQ
ncbi:16S rRNA (guanine1207-N2)-methyltransferase [Paenibacillus sp. UNCCL117]|uniref:class I SAM-dependent methyltransferase n=1 Tax=unclassified Paenibacillus TaxID=185978 RepID=UPI000885F654|nr:MULTISPECIES: class I SAM-dependent methyltransferase [unclassified Paenibacillus]SDE58585.1 16S rRNA (guanine1207-N2)-methyltransferase [Paenibacillus sp. cl123]SFW68648.1 16S rRNA (guanine1207-N2)-methyltransferase [Paenibacillus sp. UNCCL117]